MGYKGKKSNLRKENEAYINKLVENNIVRVIEPGDARLFERFKLKNYYADTTFQMLYGWQESCKFCIEEAEDGRCCLGIGVDDELSGGIIADSDIGIIGCINKLIEILSEREYVVIDNISYEQLVVIKKYLDEKGINYDTSYDEDYDDYWYIIDNYLSLEGKCNKTKRGNMNSLLRNYPDISYKEYSSDNLDEVMDIFSKWCEPRNCEACLFGCEYDALRRMLEVYSDNNVCSVVYINDEAVAFSLCANINNDVIACLIQKTKYPIRGLAFYSSYCLKEKYSGKK